MEWRDCGIIIGTRKHGETSLIVELMTANHGRHLGLVRGGRSRKLQPVLQPGNSVEAVWRARIDEHLGTYAIEPLEMTASRLMETAVGVNGIQLLGSLLRLLPERDPHGELYAALEVLIQHLSDPHTIGPLMVKFELRLLDELGFGLDLTQCAGNGSTENLLYVSPRSGQAVSAEAGKPWADKLLPLPRFLTQTTQRSCTSDELNDAFYMLSYFYNRDVYHPRGSQEPESRAGFLKAVLRTMRNSQN
jgi:DNA repair protein RecO (recombination protein O)